jgi:hypothetical protein
MKIVARFVIALVIGTTYLGSGMSVLAAPGKTEALQMCRGVDGKAQKGEVDLLLLLDNSKSLNQKNGSDTSNQRYVAVGDMLQSVVSGLGSTNKVNFALTSFGSRVNDAIKFGDEPLNTSDDALNLTSIVEDKVPGDYKKQEQTTDYISALEHAYDLFELRPADNCKILVWFTDGVFESRETRDRTDWKKQADRLRSVVCGRLANNFQDSRINTFALVLKPQNPDKSRLSASYGAMAALTGDQDLPPSVSKSIRAGDNCGGSPFHLGEVLLAEDASAIGRYMPGIANIASGAEQATEECPAVGNELESLPLPAGRHLEWISVENIEGSKLPSLDSITIRSASGSDLGEASKYLQGLPSSSKYEIKYQINELAKEELNAGWQIRIGSGIKGLCMRAKAESFSLRFSSGDGSDDQIVLIGADEKSVIVEQDVSQMSFAINGDPSGATYTLEEASGLQDEVIALLQIDTTGKIFSKPLEIRIAKRDEAVISCSSGLSFPNRLGTMPKNHTVTSETCRIDVKGTGKTIGSVSINSQGPAFEKLKECGVSLKESAIKSDGKIPVKGSNTKLEVGERSHLEVQVIASMGDTANCSVEEVSLEVNLESKDRLTTESIPVLVSFDLKKAADIRIVIILTILGIIMILFLNLLALNLLMRKLIKLPSENELKAIEVPLQLTRNQGGSISAMVNGEPLSSFRPGQENLSNVTKGDGESLIVQRGRTSLRMDRPGLFNPLGMPSVVVHPAAPAVYTPNAGENGGLAPTFKSAMVFHSVTRNDDNNVSGTLTIFVPMTGPDAGIRGAQQLLSNQTKIREISLRGIDLESKSNIGSTSSNEDKSSRDFNQPEVSAPTSRLPRIPGTPNQP